ncbi:MAG: helix-turn-helix transcriptional regulator [Clostridia bacterium]|jgi:transcriptional regulator with XRE-family HTH domain|nr:helix-turn-helix transcriptional regulator [Clostridia bacterium]
MYGKAIKQQRENAKLTQAQLAKATGIPQNSISAWEIDKYIPSIVNCVTLADFYGISVDELIGRDTNYTEQDNYTQNNVHGNNTMHVTKNYSK